MREIVSVRQPQRAPARKTHLLPSPLPSARPQRRENKVGDKKFTAAQTLEARKAVEAEGHYPVDICRKAAKLLAPKK